MSQLHSLQAKAALWRQQNMDSGMDVYFAPEPAPAVTATYLPAAPLSAESPAMQPASAIPAAQPVTAPARPEPALTQPVVTQAAMTQPAVAQAHSDAPCEKPEAIAPARAHEMLVLLLEQSALVRQHLENMRSLAQNAASTLGGATHTLAGVFARHALAIRLIVSECSYGGMALMDKDRWLESALPGIATTGSGSYQITLPAGSGARARNLVLPDYAELARSPLVCAPLEAATAAERESSLALAIKAVQLAEQGYTAQAACFAAMAAEEPA